MSTITLVSGSHKQAGESTRIAHWMAKELQSRSHATHIIEAKEFPLWDEGMWGTEGLKDKWQTIWQPHAEKLKASDGIILLSPEYNGLASAAIKNLLLLLTKAEVAHKPALLVGVSAGAGGTAPIMELRMSGSKNNRLVFLPEHLVIRSAAEVFRDNPKPEHAGANDYLIARTKYVFSQLESYMAAFKTMRQTLKIDFEAYPNGM